MSSNDVLLRLRGVSRDYRSLRPLRIAELDLPPGRSLALLGFDQTMAEVLVDLITGAILPDPGHGSVGVNKNVGADMLLKSRFGGDSTDPGNDGAGV